MESWDSCILRDIRDAVEELQQKKKEMEDAKQQQTHLESLTSPRTSFRERFNTIDTPSSGSISYTDEKRNNSYLTNRKLQKRSRRFSIRRIIKAASTPDLRDNIEQNSPQPNNISAPRLEKGSKLPSSVISDPDITINYNKLLIGGTAEKLLQLLTNVYYRDSSYISDFLNVYQFFMTTAEVLEHVVNFYFHSSPDSDTLKSIAAQKYVLFKRQRVLLIVVKWIEYHAEDFAQDAKLLEKMKSLLYSIGEPSAISTFKKYFEMPAIVPPQIKGRETEFNCHVLCKFEPMHMAQQLAIVDHVFFREITAAELRKQQWTKSDSDVISPNVTRHIRHFNQVSYWVATEVLKQCCLDSRIEALATAICIASESIKLQSYNMAMAILCGLSLSSVSRLRETWSGLSIDHKSTFEYIEKFLSPDGNYLRLRQATSKEQPPVAPYFGMYLKDLTFLDVGNEAYLNDSMTHINFEKLRMISAVISEIQELQILSYPFADDPAVQRYLYYTTTPFNDVQLYKISRIVEPATLAESPEESISTSRIRKLLSMKSTI